MTKRRQAVIAEIKNIKRKTALQQYCHNEQATLYAKRAKWFDIVLIVLSALAMLLTTSAAEILFLGILDKLSIVRASAFLTLIVFALTVLRLALKWRDAASSSLAAGDAFTRLLRKLDMQLTSLDSLTEEQLKQEGMQITEAYNSVVDFVPMLPSERFMELKRDYLQQKEISKELDSNAFRSLDEIKSGLKKESRK